MLPYGKFWCLCLPFLMDKARLIVGSKLSDTLVENLFSSGKKIYRIEMDASLVLSCKNTCKSYKASHEEVRKSPSSSKKSKKRAYL